MTPTHLAILLDMVQPDPEDHGKYLTIILRSGYTVEGVLIDHAPPGYIRLDHGVEGQTFLEISEICGINANFNPEASPSEEIHDDEEE